MFCPTYLKEYYLMTFRLSDDFIASYTSRPVPWGFTDVAGNSVGEITFLRTYSRIKSDGTKETWVDCCRRVIEGMFEIQRTHAQTNRLPWSYVKAQRTAEDAFDRLFNFKWTPPGRGLWMMGTPLVMEQRNSAALQNCAFVSTNDMTFNDPAAPFAFLMEASMLGIGVGFDTKGADKGFRVYTPAPGANGMNVDRNLYVIPDTREGWVRSVELLIESYLLKNGRPPVEFDYSLIRKAGEPIKTFGGTAAGPGPLRKLHASLTSVFERRKGENLTREDVLDIGNMIGVCVVSGNVRRSAELAMGSITDEVFLNAKDFSQYKQDADGNFVVSRQGTRDDRAEWGWMSNNSVEVKVGDDLSPIIEGIQRNGEPGVIWMDLARDYGRIKDGPNGRDHRVAGFNPCAEQSLESYECCTLVETYLGRADSLEDYKRTLKVAYLYAKTVTLLPTHWPKTNAIMARNRRIGTSAAGAANFADRRGYNTLRTWWDESYAAVAHWDRVYSEWLGIRESIKMTTIKPGGTTPILAGDSPGVHWAPGARKFYRLIRFSKADPQVQQFRWANYRIEDAVESPETTVVVYFPIESDILRSEKDVSIFEKVALAALAQEVWSDNSVSVTVSFDPETEAQHIPTVLSMYEGKLKTISFLPMGGAYRQMPYTEITDDEFEAERMKLMKIDLTSIYAGTALDATGEAFCTTDACEVNTIKSAQEA